MNLKSAFLGCLMAITAAAPAASAAPSPTPGISSASAVEFSPQLAAKLNALPGATKKTGFGQVWVQSTFVEIQDPGAADGAIASSLSPQEAFDRANA